MRQIQKKNEDPPAAANALAGGSVRRRRRASGEARRSVDGRLRDQDRGGRPHAGRGDDPEAAAADSGESGADVGQRDVGAAAGADGLRIKAHAVVDHAELVVVLQLAASDGHGSLAALGLADAVGHGVFHQRLQGQGRQGKGLAFQIVDDVEIVAEAELLQGKVILRVAQLLVKQNGLVVFDGLHVMPQKTGKLSNGLFRLLRIDAAERLDGSEGVVEEMRLDLSEHQIDLQLFRLLLLPVVSFGLVGGHIHQNRLHLAIILFYHLDSQNHMYSHLYQEYYFAKYKIQCKYYLI